MLGRWASVATTCSRRQTPWLQVCRQVSCLINLAASQETAASRSLSKYFCTIKASKLNTT
jgi:hypothetical protein